MKVKQELLIKFSYEERKIKRKCLDEQECL